MISSSLPPEELDDPPEDPLEELDDPPEELDDPLEDPLDDSPDELEELDELDDPPDELASSPLPLSPEHASIAIEETRTPANTNGIDLCMHLT